MEQPNKRFLLHFPQNIKSVKDLTNQKKLNFKKIDPEYYIIETNDMNVEVLEITL